MRKFGKALVGAAAAAAMAVSATPALAKHRDDDKISAGDVIAGAVILGGIAAILTSKNRRDGRDYDRSRRGNRGYGYDDGYNNNYRRRGSRRAVKRCIRRAENRASRYGNAKVTEIRDIDRTRYGYKIRGRIIVNNGYRGRGYNNYNHNRRGNGYGNYNHSRRGYGRNDRGKFTCYVERGRVVDVRYKGLGNYR
ncbi:MAG: hypothetical protein V3V15_10945 [Sphingorhabdus sp.]